MKTKSRRASLLLVILAIFCFPVYMGADFDPRHVLGDQTINDDLFVIGSLCLGLDCTGSEVFAFDDIRIKEQNIRIDFEDPSNAPFRV